MPSDWWTRVPVGISSYGRMVVPPLHFWKGESIRDIYNCFGTHMDDKYCNCLELNGAKMLNKFFESTSIKSEFDMNSKTFIVSVADSMRCRTRNVRCWSMPDKLEQRILRERLSKRNYKTTRQYKRKLNRQETDESPPNKKTKTVGVVLGTRSVGNHDRRKDCVRSSVEVKPVVSHALSSAGRVLKQQKNINSNRGSFLSQHILLSSADTAAMKAINARKKSPNSSCLEPCYQIRDSWVVLSPLSSSELKLLKRGKLNLGLLKNVSRKQKDGSITRAIQRELSRTVESENFCDGTKYMCLDKKLQRCSSCDDKRIYCRPFAQNNFDVKPDKKFLKAYPNLLDLRVRLVDLRHLQHDEVQSLRTFCETPKITIKEEKDDDILNSNLTSCPYWLRQVKPVVSHALSSAGRVLKQQKNINSNRGSFLSQHILLSSADTAAMKVIKARKESPNSSCLEPCYQIRDSWVVLSPLSSSELKLLKRGKLNLGLLKNVSWKQKENNTCSSRFKYKRQNACISSPPRRKKSASSLEKKVTSGKQNGRQNVTSKHKQTDSMKMTAKHAIVHNMTTPTKTHPLSVSSASTRRKKYISKTKIRKSRRRMNSSDLFEDPLYACLLSSSESEYSVNFDDFQPGYSEKQSTPLSKYLDVRDDSTDRVSVKSTPTRFHTKAELKQHVSKVRRMRAEKLRKSKKKAKKESEKLISYNENENVEELSAFEQLKRALGLMDKVQQKICDDTYSEEERYFTDSDN